MIINKDTYSFTMVEFVLFAIIFVGLLSFKMACQSACLEKILTQPDLWAILSEVIIVCQDFDVFVIYVVWLPCDLIVQYYVSFLNK